MMLSRILSVSWSVRCGMMELETGDAIWGGVSGGPMNDFLWWRWDPPVGRGSFFWSGGRKSDNAMQHIGRMWHHGVDVVYRRLSDWTRPQWPWHS